GTGSARHLARSRAPRRRHAARLRFQRRRRLRRRAQTLRVPAAGRLRLHLRRPRDGARQQVRVQARRPRRLQRVAVPRGRIRLPRGVAVPADQEQPDRFRLGTCGERPHAPGRRDRVRGYGAAGGQGHALARQPVPRGSHLSLDAGRRGVDGKGIGIAEIDVRPYEFSRSLSAFFQNIAANEPRGLFPRYLCGEQTYWTPVGSALGGVTQALLNEDGLLEVDRGTFSIEPFLYVGEELVTWADGSPTQELEQGFLPIPSSVWRKDGIALKATAFATGE